MPTKKTKQKLKKLNDRGYATSSAPRKQASSSLDMQADEKVVWVSLALCDGGVRMTVGPATAAPAVAVDASPPAAAAVTRPVPPVDPVQALAAEQATRAEDAAAKSSGGAGPSKLPAACAATSGAVPQTAGARRREEARVRAAAAAEARVRAAAEQGDDEDDSVFMLDEEVGALSPRPQRAASDTPASCGRAERVSAPADYATAASPLGSSPAAGTLGSIPILGLPPVAQRSGESIDSNRAWRPTDTANNIPLDVYSTSAPADLSSCSAFPVLSSSPGSSILAAAPPSLTSASVAFAASASASTSTAPASTSTASASANTAAAASSASASALTPRASSTAEGSGAADTAAAAGPATPTCAECSDAESDSSEEGVMCAICHGNIQPLQVAMIRGCEHPFCGGCILNWALQKSKCPLCNVAFTHVWMYRQLDGEYNDYLVEESVQLLHSAAWFRKQHAPTRASHCDADAAAHDSETSQYHEMLQYRYGGGASDDEDEDYYYELQARLGGAKRAIGNRRFGEGGFVQGGRRAARASLAAPTTPGKKWSKGGESSASGGGDEPLTPGRGESGGSSQGGYSRKASIKAEKAAQKEAKKSARAEMVRSNKIAMGKAL